MHDIERRAFMKGAAIGALAFTVGGAEVLLTPRAARAQGVALRTLTPAQAAMLDGAIGEWTARHDIDAVLEKLAEAEVPAGRIYSVADIVADPHY